MAAVLSKSQAIFLAVLAGLVAGLLWDASRPSASTVLQTAPATLSVASKVAETPTAVAPTLAGGAETTAMPTVPSTPELEWNETGQLLEDVGRAAFPLMGAVGAVLTGLWVRRVADDAGAKATTMEPMAMAAEATPLTRRSAFAALAAFPMAAATPALAAKTGGRIGGSGGFRSFSQQRATPPPPPAGNTTVFVNPSPPMVVAPYGVAPVTPFGFGFSTGELLALSALELGDAFLREQRRQEYLRQQLEIQRQLGRDQAQIESLQQQLAAQDQRMRELQTAMQQKGVPAPAQ